MSTVNLKLMACALCGEKDGCTGGAGTHIRPYGPTHRTRAKDHATTPVPSCQPSGIRYALRVSRLPPLSVDTRTKLLRPNSCVFMRATIWAEQQNGLCWFQACVTKRFRGSRRIPQGWSSQPLGREVILSHVCAGSAMAAVFMLLSSSYITMPVMGPRPGRGVGVLSNIVMIYGEDIDYDGCSSWEDQLVAQESAWMMDPRTEHQMAHNVEWAVPQYIADGAPWIEQPHMDNAWPEPWMAEQPMGLWPPQPAEILTDSYYPGQYPLNRPGPNGLAY